MARQQGIGHGARHHRGVSAEGRSVQRRADRRRRRLPHDEPRRGHRAARRADRHAGEIPRACRRGRRTALSGVHAGGALRHERPHARQRRHRRRRRIRYRRGRRQHEPARSDGAGHPSRARRLRPETARRRRHLLRHHAGAHLGDVAVRISAPARRLHRLHHRRRLVVRGACRARTGGTRGGPVLGGGDRLWQHAAHGRSPPGLGARIQPVRNAVPSVPARHRLRARRIAPHARIRHHARTVGRGGGSRSRMGAAESGGLGEEAPHDRRGACPRGRSAIRSPCATAA